MGRHPHSFAVPVPVIPPLANRKPRWEQAGLTRSTSSTAACVPHAQQACLVVADQSQAGLQCGGRPPPLARPTLPGVSAGTRDTRQSAKFIQLIKSGQCSPPWSFSFLFPHPPAPFTVRFFFSSSPRQLSPAGNEYFYQFYLCCGSTHKG